MRLRRCHRGSSGVRGHHFGWRYFYDSLPCSIGVDLGIEDSFPSNFGVSVDLGTGFFNNLGTYVSFWNI